MNPPDVGIIMFVRYMVRYFRYLIFIFYLYFLCY